MKPFIVLYVLRWYFIHSELYSVCDGFRDTAAAPSLGQKDIPRLLLNQDGVHGSQLLYRSTQNHSVFFQTEGSDDLYVGGTDFVLKVNVDNNSIVEEFSLNATGTQDGSEGSHHNVITVIQRFQDSLFVCGTNGHTPQCWKLHSQVNNESQEIIESYEGTGISPYVYTHNSLSLIVDGDLYAAAPLDSDGSSLQFRRKAGGRTNVWMYEKWVSEPTFISASWVKREDDPDNEKIYVFFREKNSDSSPEADPWISRVARVCKVDEGGSKRFFQNMWTSFLKARLVCGFPDEPLYFNRLQDVFVQHSEEDWRLTRVYALFTSSWNATALCIYSIADIEEIFDKSTFKGYEKEIPTPRPGTCVRNSRGLPLATVNVVKDHPEMSDWIQPLRHHAPSYTNHAPSYTNHYDYTNRGHAPFYTNHYNYTKIVVDRVQAADQRTYNVLLLATDSGKIHKVLEDGSEPFIIAETQLSNHSAVQSMKLHSRKKKLLVGFREQISILDLQRCSDYNSSCEACVLARDPYCAWTESGCKPTVPGAIQNIPGVQINISCPNPEAALGDSKKTNNNRTRRDHQSAASPGVAPGGVAPGGVAVLRAVHSVPLGAPFYLSCPIDSYHARYTWTHHHHRGGRDDVDADHHRTTSHPCQQMQSDCLHLIPGVTRDSYGEYRCVSTERRYTRVVKEYQLAMQSSSPSSPPPSRTAVIGVAEQDDEKRSVPEGNHGNGGGVGLAAPPAGWVAMCVATAVTVSRLFNV